MPARDANGDPLSGAKLFVYQNGTTTPAATFSDVGLSVPRSHPIVANDAGRFGLIYANNISNYTVAVTTADGVPLAGPWDNISPSIDAVLASVGLSQGYAEDAEAAADAAAGSAASAAQSATNAADDAEEAEGHSDAAAASAAAAAGAAAAAVAGKADLDLGNATFTQGTAAAVVRPALGRSRESWSLLDAIPANLHAAIADGTSMADVSTFLNAASEDMILERPGALATIPPGLFNLENTWVIDETDTAAWDARQRLNLRGAGSGLTHFFLRTNDMWAIDVRGGPFAGAGANGRRHLGGFMLRGESLHADAGQRGLKLNKDIGAIYDDLFFNAFYDPFEFSDVVGASFRSLNVFFCNHGGQFIPGPDALSSGTADGSPPNEMVLLDCHWVGVPNGRLLFDYSGNIKFVGGAMESCGGIVPSVTLEADTPGILFRNMGHNAGVAISMDGFHFESNQWATNVRIEGGAANAVYVFDCVDDLSNGAVYANSHLDIDNTAVGAGTMKVKLRDNSFRGVNAYTPSAGRKRVTVAGPNVTVEDDGSFWESADERPDFLPWTPGWTAYTPTPGAGTGAFTSVSAAARFTHLPNRAVAARVAVTIATNGTAGQAVFVNLPVKSKEDVVFFGQASGAVPLIVQAFAGSVSARIVKLDGTYPGADGVVLEFNGVYEGEA